MMTLTGQLASATTGPAPPIEVFPAQGEHTGIGLIIFPGGGYGQLAEHEGKGYADRFSAAGIACFVVSYRLGSAGHRHPAMLEDALAAVATVRRQAAEFGVGPDRLGVMGSSAGGHLTAHTLVAHGQYASDVPLRPNFGVLCYPVISTTGRHAHAGSMANLTGGKLTPELAIALSPEKHVTKDTPPCFLWHTGEDAAVTPENSLLFAAALREAGVPFELHIYEKGRHGLGLGAPFDWAGDCLRWIRDTVAV